MEEEGWMEEGGGKEGWMEEDREVSEGEKHHRQCVEARL